MKVLAIAAVTAGGKTTVTNALKSRLPKTATLHFDDYSFEGAVEDFHQWVVEGADYNVWDLSPLEKDVLSLRDSGQYEYLLLDYPFAYRHERLKKYIDFAVFIDTPLDVALARRILRDYGDAAGGEIRREMEMYLKYARPAYAQMLKDILPSSDFVADGTKAPDAVADEIIGAFLNRSE